jgi:hemoglobin-like flavoprotein
MLTERQKKVIVETWRLVVPIAETAADLFYKRLFELRPDYQALFKSDMASQKRKLLAMLSFVVKALDWPEEAWRDNISEDSDLFLVVLALGRRHSSLYNVPDEAYGAVGQALLWTLDYGLGKRFDDEARDAWTQVYTLLSLTMKMGRLSVQPREESDRAVMAIVAPAAAARPPQPRKTAP